ncbi:NmrA-like family domain-containing protein [Lachnellula suecica]|uniref:NmrA-like family domain-containing protein n=1 Tax=Lachnellula suecica TaxID=602035 RepID=A0A8T9BXW5_9HELO|nr:NmrA-like family domain-containing protein [Lachnellula suecica]
MANDEKTAYIDAELCLMNPPATLGFNGAQTKWDELLYCHAWQSNVVQYSGQFLPWHRYYMYAHEQQLKNVCNYTGGQPYWEEFLDSVASPGDPLFYLHHANLDRLWWEWQAANFSSRLYDLGGFNSPPVWWLEKKLMINVTAAQIEGFNGPEVNTTSLQHNLDMEVIVPNRTISEVMDIANDLLCYERFDQKSTISRFFVCGPQRQVPQFENRGHESAELATAIETREIEQQWTSMEEQYNHLGRRDMINSVPQHGEHYPASLATAVLLTVTALSLSQTYSVRVLTRNTSSRHARNLTKLPNVTLIQGSQDNQKDLHRAFEGVYGAYVNTDGFTLGEKAELFYGIRAYEIARAERVTHYIWANTDYALKKAGWDEKYHWGHNDAKGRVGDLILSHGQGGMRTSLLTTGPYMDMLFDGMFVPSKQPDGSFVWANPAVDGKIPLIALDDVGAYALWILDHIEESAGMNLEIATEEVSFQDIARTFTAVTGLKAIHKHLPLEEYLPLAEPYPNAYANWAADPNAPRDESSMTWRENFSAWWRFWGEGWGADRKYGMLDRIHPTRIRSLAEWMEKVGYVGEGKSVLKNIADLKASA